MPAYNLRCECGWTHETPGIAHVREAIEWHEKSCPKSGQGKKVYVDVTRKCCDTYFNSIDGVENRGWGGGHLCCAPCHPCYIDSDELDMMREQERQEMELKEQGGS
jgi:hypothetical protein